MIGMQGVVLGWVMGRVRFTDDLEPICGKRIVFFRGC